MNRLYYACFHAAQAALYDRDIDPTSHGAVRNQFGAHLVLDGELSRDQGRFLSTLADLRQQADYGYAPIEADMDRLFERAQTFVDDIGTLLDLDGSN